MGPAHHESSLNDVAPLLVRNFADIGVFYLVQSDGELRRAAAATRDPAKGWIADVIMHCRPRRPEITSQGRSFATENR